MTRRDQKLLISLVRTLSSDLDTCEIQCIAERYSTSISKTIRYKGRKTAANHYKKMYLFCRNISLGLDLPAPVPFTATDKQGIPKVIKPLLPLLTGSVDDARIGLIIARFYESIFVKPDPDLSAISAPSSSIELEFEEFFEFISKKIPKIARNIRSPDNFKVVNRQVSGPNGPAMLTAHYDAIALYKDGMLDRLNSLSEIFPKWEYWKRWSMNQAFYAHKLLEPEKIQKLKTGKLSFLSEAGGKSRVIAIGDYWSQMALRPCHDIIMTILGRMKTDGTWNQDKQSERILIETKGKTCYSFDLSSATDRFPIRPQQLVIECLFGKRYSDWWRDILTNRSFHMPNGETIRWASGQPLGMYSSWATFSLTHHLLIEYCAFKEGIKSFREYAILGDDVVIWNEMVASRYKLIMHQWGVSINMDKSIISREGKSQIEFAKRLFKEGQEISGLKFTVLRSSSNNIKLLPDLFRLMKLRGYSPYPDRFIPEHILNDKVKLYATVLLIEAGVQVRPYGVTLDHTFVHELKKETFKMRIRQLVEQRDAVWDYLSGNKPIGEMFKQQGICIDAEQIDPVGGNFDETKFHPIVWELNRRGEQVMDLLNHLYDIDPDNTDLQPGPLPVEYIPMVKNSVFFGDRQSLKSEWHSSLVLKAFRTEPLQSLLTYNK